HLAAGGGHADVRRQRGVGEVDDHAIRVLERENLVGNGGGKVEHDAGAIRSFPKTNALHGHVGYGRERQRNKKCQQKQGVTHCALSNFPHVLKWYFKKQGIQEKFSMFSVGKARLFESASGKGEATRSAGSVEWGNITQPSGSGRILRLQPDLATGVSKGNPADQVRRRHVALALLRPLDQQPAGTVVEIAQAEELQLLGIGQAIEVEVHRLTE